MIKATASLGPIATASRRATCGQRDIWCPIGGTLDAGLMIFRPHILHSARIVAATPIGMRVN